MPDKRFYEYHGQIALPLILESTGGVLLDQDVEGKVISDISTPEAATSTDLIFFSDLKRIKAIKDSQAGFCLTTQQLASRLPKTMAVIIVKNPRLAFSKVAEMFYLEYNQEMGQSLIHPDAIIEDGAFVSPFVRVGKGAKIGKGVVVGDFAVIGDRAEIGEGSRIGNGSQMGIGVIIGTNSQISDNCTIKYLIAGKEFRTGSGVRVGMEGYGFEQGDKGLVRVPQLGLVIIGDRVEIDYNSVVERGALGNTEIGSGTKIASLVMVGHNVKIGKHGLLISQSGVAGSSTLGDQVILAAQAGVKDNITIGNGVQIASQSGVTCDIPDGFRVEGSPAVPVDKSNLLGRLLNARKSFTQPIANKEEERKTA